MERSSWKDKAWSRNTQILNLGQAQNKPNSDTCWLYDYGVFFSLSETWFPDMESEDRGTNIATLPCTCKEVEFVRFKACM